MMHIWYFKAHTEEYQTQTETRGYSPHFIPVLDQTYTSKHLTEILQQGRQTISGIILTSQRSVTTLCESNRALTPAQRLDWQAIPLYIVGENTTLRLKTTLRDQLFFLPNEPPCPIVTTDHASALGDHLVNQTSPTRLLFLAGDKRRDQLPDRLVQHGFSLTEIQTYNTTNHPDLCNTLSPVVFDPQHWSVFFSPSGVDSFLSVRQTIPTKIAAIGRTTASHLSQLGYSAHAIAARPSVSHLLDAIIEYDQKLPLD